MTGASLRFQKLAAQPSFVSPCRDRAPTIASSPATKVLLSMDTLSGSSNEFTLRVALVALSIKAGCHSSLTDATVKPASVTPAENGC